MGPFVKRKNPVEIKTGDLCCLHNVFRTQSLDSVPENDALNT